MGWQFRSYVNSGTDVLAEWFCGLPAEAQAQIAGQIGYMRITPVERWTERDEYRDLQDELATLGEIRIFWPIENARRGQPARYVHYRILGFLDRAGGEFTMLAGFKKERGQADYDEYGALALTRFTEVRANRLLFSRTAEWIDP